MATTTSSKYHYGLGRRKSATVRVRLSIGKGTVIINGKPAAEYFDQDEQLLWRLNQPLKLVELLDKYDVSLRASGGGLSGQVDAAILAIANALADMNDDLRSTLKKAGFLKRDPREKERKKFGLKRARKQEQFSKR